MANIVDAVSFLWRVLVFIAFVGALRLALGLDLDRRFLVWALTILVIFGLLTLIGPLIDKACETEDRLWGSLARRLRRRPPRGRVG
jgi:hypothetical protein